MTTPRFGDSALSLRDASPPAQISAAEFTRIRNVLHELAGINLTPGKEGLVMSRLSKRLRALGIDSYGAYIAHVESEANGAELAMMIDVLTTNKTSFFREAEHFEHLRTVALPELTAGKNPLRLWCAACSSGEEPYTLSMVLNRTLDSAQLARTSMLATDISARMVARAKAGIYTADQTRDVPPELLKQYFRKSGSAADTSYQVTDELRAPVRFGRLNLMEPWPMKGKFEIIFCRNVMIYFDTATQERLVRRFYDMLTDGGYLYVGHAESLTSMRHAFRYVRPAVYAK
jgi:chemotaxis protein methyltransferase CheR